MTHPTARHLRILGMHRRAAGTDAIYRISDRLHHGRTVDVRADEIATTVSAWLAELGAHSPLVDDLARAVHDGNWPAAHGLGECLSVDVTVAA